MGQLRRVNIGSVVDALRFNSASALLGVCNGSDWYLDVSHLSFPDDGDVMHQEVECEVSVEEGLHIVEFNYVRDYQGQLSTALLEAMRTNTTVQRFGLSVPYLHRGHLTAITDSLMENDTLRSFSLQTEHTEGGVIFRSPLDTRAAFSRVMAWNVSLQELVIEYIGDNEIDPSDPSVPLDLGGPIVVATFWQCFCYVFAMLLRYVG